MERRAYLAALGTGSLAALAGCSAVLGGGSSLAEDEYDVGMSASAFQPNYSEVGVGETLVWGNTSGRSHTVTAYAGGIPDGAAYFASGDFDSQDAAEAGWTQFEGAIEPGTTYSHTFEVPGEYSYYCIPHEAMGMQGTVVVTE